jgi:phage baseplate assembly protein W
VRTLKIPFRVDGGGRLATTTSPDEALEQYITDLLVTDKFQRLMLASHGANLGGFLFSPILSVIMATKAQEVQTYLNRAIPFGQVVSVSMYPSQQEGAVRVAVQFKTQDNADLQSTQLVFTGVVSEETDL